MGPRWRARYSATAALCSFSVAENTWLPSPLGEATKNNASVSAGRALARMAAAPGSAIGVGGSPVRV